MKATHSFLIVHTHAHTHTKDVNISLEKYKALKISFLKKSYSITEIKSTEVKQTNKNSFKNSSHDPLHQMNLYSLSGMGGKEEKQKSFF